MSMRLQRFDFGNLRDFRGPLVVPEAIEDLQEEIAPPPPPPPTFSEEDVEIAKQAAHKLGYAEGYEAGISHAAQQADQKRIIAENTITQLSSAIADLPYRYQQLLTHESAQLSELVLLIARKLTGVVLEKHAADAVGSLITRCLPVVLSKPMLVIELNPAAFEHTMDRIESLLKANGYEGQVQFRSNAEIGQYDAVLDWGTGQAVRSTAALWNEIESLMTTMPITLSPVAAPAATPLNADQSGSESADYTPPTA